MQRGQIKICRQKNEIKLKIKMQPKLYKVKQANKNWDTNTDRYLTKSPMATVPVTMGTGTGHHSTRDHRNDKLTALKSSKSLSSLSA